MADYDFTIFINTYRMDALEKVLTQNGGSLENEVQKFIQNLYEQCVPEEERSMIENRVQKEREEAQAEMEAARRFAVIHIHDSADDIHFLSEIHNDFLSAARVYRMAVRSISETESILERMTKKYIGHQMLSPSEFSDYCDSIVSDVRVTALIEFDLEEGVVGVCESSDNAWWYYNLKDVSNAVFRADRRADLKPQVRREIFDVYLQGKEMDYGETTFEPAGPELSM